MQMKCGIKSEFMSVLYEDKFRTTHWCFLKFKVVKCIMSIPANVKILIDQCLKITHSCSEMRTMELNV